MSEFWSWFSGDLSTEARILSAVAPALLPILWFIGAMVGYAVHVKRAGPHIDAEVEDRQTSPLLGLSLRRAVDWSLQPFWRAVRATTLPPAALTTLSVFLAAGAGVAVAAGRFSLGGWIFLVAGVFDMLDGRLARATNTASARGAALDSVLDRMSDAALLVGLAWYYRGSWVLLATLVAIVSSHLVSYVRARGEGLGVSVRDGWLGRPERVVILGLTVALSPAIAALQEPLSAHPMHWLAVAGVLIVAVGATLTAAVRFIHLLARLDTRHLRGRSLGLGEGSAFRAGVAAAVATAVDAASVVALVAVLDAPAWLATLAGCGVGAVVNFSLGRSWAFDGSEGPRGPQARRYGVVWTGSSLLNAGGVGLLLLLPGLDYRVAWVIVRAVVFFGWNYQLQRDYVFAPADGVPHDA
ncbi:MAG: CDP-alcohol phosphatidyltransferase [Deltaproteobacteria bacterium HGW-Deltaproteobacteria-14]|jgi:phosphatidylglycerophosphate synthase|nr:MAG: CDP-alcohol phosphatidyltransferase [Deltaproteobacteria bacterium HGW-Deltaproteobacteria-14]